LKPLLLYSRLDTRVFPFTKSIRYVQDWIASFCHLLVLDLDLTLYYLHVLLFGLFIPYLSLIEQCDWALICQGSHFH
jgi:hypothetical protein